MEEYNVVEYVVNGFAYFDINKVMYGLSQSGNISNDKLIKELAVKVFEPTNHTPGLWKHRNRPVTFAIVVDGSGIKYTHKEDAEMLLNTLRQKYEAVSADWSGKLFCGMHMEWYYKDRTVDVDMKGYIKKVREKYQHEMPIRPENQPHKNTIPNYGAKVQLTEPKDTPNPLGP